MRWCSEHGLPHSHLLGWDPVDRAKLVADLLEASSRCQLCGTSPWEWEADQFAYEPAQETCRGCYLKESAEDDVSSTRGTRIVLIPKRVAEARRVRPKRRPSAAG